jgi:hypothetical protein
LGEIEFNNGKNNEKINDLGLYSVALLHHQNEKQRIIDAKKKIKYENEHNRDWAKLLRKFRDIRLFDSDWTQIVDNSLTEDKKKIGKFIDKNLEICQQILTSTSIKNW